MSKPIDPIPAGTAAKPVSDAEMAEDLASPADAGDPQADTGDLQADAGDVEYVWEDDPVWARDETTAMLGSTLLNVIVILALAMIPLRVELDAEAVVLVADPPEYQDQELEAIDEITYSDIPQEDIGANSLAETSMAEASAAVFAEVSEIPNPVEVPIAELGTIAVNNRFEQAVAPLDKLDTQRGKIGVGTEGAKGSVDRITAELLESIEERPTLVVWLFDQSGSLHRQRRQIRDQFDRVYDQLGILLARESGITEAADPDDAPLLTSIIGFGQTVNLYTEEPTADIDEIKSIVDRIETDSSGEEKVFSAVIAAATKYRDLRRSRGKRGPERNVTFVVVTDERGDDVARMEEAVNLCRKNTIPVHVIGVPAPFGRQHTLVRYVDPDPKFDQSAQWAQVDQGPESLVLEHVHLGLSGNFQEEPPIDSGFGPYGLTRLAIDTGGLYFANHPNRRVGREVRRYEVEDYASELKHFFDPSVMRRYQPQYISAREYQQQVQQSPLRRALVQAAAAQANSLRAAGGIDRPKTRFVKRGDEAQLVQLLNEAQKDAAKLAPRLNSLLSILASGMDGREQETEPRWQAGYDLAMGRVIAQSVRTDAYNSMLAEVKRGKPFKDPKNNTWILEAADEISVGSRYQRQADQARELLQNVVNNHAGTPWSLLAEKELSVPMGWRWKEEYTELDPPRQRGPGNNNNNPRPAQDDKKRMLKKKPKRPLPKL
ncbi:MAG: vWA domain-containing protein [Planctomycetota bacterium]